jgi:Cu(I)-responsive transcriptional regulator
MNIGEAARESGLSAKTIRYYEEVGLVRADRRGNNYRDYPDATVRRLRLLARARALGFSLAECRQLVALHENSGRASADVRRLAEAHIDAIDDKLRELHAMRAALVALTAACPGDHGPDCPILEGLTGDAGQSPIAAAS